MASWECNQDGTVFTVGAERCPSADCGARDAHEQGGEPDLNVYDAVAVTGIVDPGAAWGAVNEKVAALIDENRRAGRDVVSHAEGLALILKVPLGEEVPPVEDDPVAQRLGLVPGDEGASDAGGDPDPVVPTPREKRS